MVYYSVDIIGTLIQKEYFIHEEKNTVCCHRRNYIG